MLSGFDHLGIKKIKKIGARWGCILPRAVARDWVDLPAPPRPAMILSALA